MFFVLILQVVDSFVWPKQLFLTDLMKSLCLIIKACLLWFLSSFNTKLLAVT